MEMSPELQKSIKTSLSLFMDEHEADQFMNLNNVTSLVKQGQPPWQALVSIGVHAAELYTQETDIEKAILQELVGQALEPVDTLFWSVLPKPGEKPLEGEQARLLFHTRFALGFLLLAGADKKRSKAILHDMAATKVSVRGHSYYEGSGILSCTDDIRGGKLQATTYLLTEYVRQKDYYEILYLITEAVACTPWATYSLVGIVPVILDLSVAECEKEGDYDVPGLEWLWLFVEVGELLSLCGEYDSSGPAPNECKKESPQYLAWKIGQIAGRFAARWSDDPFNRFQGFRDAIGEEEYQSERGEEKTRETVMAILALLREYDPARDWQKMRGQCLSIWEMSYSYSGMPLSEIGPCHDLYWAMRIGFADKVLETMPGQAVTEIRAVPPPIIRNIEMIGDIFSTVALRLLKQQQSFDRVLERLPPTKREIQQWLQQQLDTVWHKLPAKVVNTLVKAEAYYKSEVDDDNAKVWFHKAVEASLNCCVVEPLVNWIQERGDTQIAVCFPPPRGVERMSSGKLHKLSVQEWSDVLDTLAASPRKDLASLGTKRLKEFMETHLGGPRLPDLRSLAHSVRMVHQYRKGSAHYQEALSRCGKEKWELEQMRNLVLGISEPSVITQIFQLLSAKNQP